MNAILWFSLLTIVIRYFQTNININRQYKYIHFLEDKFTNILGESIISREGKHYLSNYPGFPKFMDFLYTWVFPVMLVATGLLEIIEEWPGYKDIRMPYLLGIIFYLIIVTSVVLYIIHLKSSSKRNKRDKSVSVSFMRK